VKQAWDSASLGRLAMDERMIRAILLQGIKFESGQKPLSTSRSDDSALRKSAFLFGSA